MPKRLSRGPDPASREANHSREKLALLETKLSIMCKTTCKTTIVDVSNSQTLTTFTFETDELYWGSQHKLNYRFLLVARKSHVLRFYGKEMHELRCGRI